MCYRCEWLGVGVWERAPFIPQPLPLLTCILQVTHRPLLASVPQSPPRLRENGRGKEGMGKGKRGHEEALQSESYRAENGARLGS